MADELSLQRVMDALSTHGHRTFTFYTKKASSRRSFAEMRAEIANEARGASGLGLGPNVTVGVVGENSYHCALLDLVLLSLSCTSVQPPESTAAATLAEIGEALDFLALAPEYERLAASETYSRVGTLCGFALFERKRADRMAPRDERFRGLPAVVFSSGTSGKIKRLLVSAPGIIHSARFFFSALDLAPDDSFLIFLPLSNFQQKLLIYGCILFGVDIYLTDAQNILSALPATAPTLFLAPPIFYESAWKLAQVSLGADGAAAAPPERLKAAFGGRMRMMWSGMAPISPEILAGYRDAGVPLLEAYGMTEFGPITANLRSRNRIGAVGRPLVAGSVRLAPDGEVIACAEYPLTIGYWGSSAADEKAVYLDPRSVATGDIGYFDQDGYLYLRGRKKEIILTSSGYKIHPQLVESQFMGLPSVKHAVVMGNNQPYLGALIMVQAMTPDIVSAITAKIDELNSGICKSFPIKKWSLQVGELSVENGMLTRNLKVNRSRVLEKYEATVFAASP